MNFETDDYEEGRYSTNHVSRELTKRQEQERKRWLDNRNQAEKVSREFNSELIRKYNEK